MTLAGALALSTGVAFAADPQATGPQDRVHAISARMAHGGSYDRATINALAATSDDSPALVPCGRVPAVGSYDRAWASISQWQPEKTDTINARWEQHLGAMTAAGGAHDAGWVAVAR
jgi:hypothetical protein